MIDRALVERSTDDHALESTLARPQRRQCVEIGQRAHAAGRDDRHMGCCRAPHSVHRRRDLRGCRPCPISVTTKAATPASSNSWIRSCAVRPEPRAQPAHGDLAVALVEADRDRSGLRQAVHQRRLLEGGSAEHDPRHPRLEQRSRPPPRLVPRPRSAPARRPPRRWPRSPPGSPGHRCGPRRGRPRGSTVRRRPRTLDACSTGSS